MVLDYLKQTAPILKKRSIITSEQIATLIDFIQGLERSIGDMGCDWSEPYFPLS